MVEYDENGNLLMPEPFRRAIERKKAEEKLMNTFQKELSVDYDGVEYGDFIKCMLNITRPPEIDSSIIRGVKIWTDKHVELKSTARVCLMSNNHKGGLGQDLIISGRGKDERCTWCRMFRTALRTKMINSECRFVQENVCDFDLTRY